MAHIGLGALEEQDALLTTQEGAELVGISHPTLVRRMLGAGGAGAS
jgi:hypothetical protein